MKRTAFSILPAMLCATWLMALDSPSIEVNGSATLNITPDRIAIEIGMREYYDSRPSGDSTLVKLAEIENRVRNLLKTEGVADSAITMSDIGDFCDRNPSSRFLMGKTLHVTLSDFTQLESIAENIGSRGITSFMLVSLDNSEMERYNKEGLEAALEAAREKAEYMAKSTGMTIVKPWEIVETSSNYPGQTAFSNVAINSGTQGIESIRKIARRYSVKVRYILYPDN